MRAGVDKLRLSVKGAIMKLVKMMEGGVEAPIPLAKWKCHVCGREYYEWIDICMPCLKKEDDLRPVLLAEIQELLPRAFYEGHDFLVYWMNMTEVSEEWLLLTKKGEYYLPEEWWGEYIAMVDMDTFMAGKHSIFRAWEGMKTDRLKRRARFLKLKIKYPGMSEYSLHRKIREEDASVDNVGEED